MILILGELQKRDILPNWLGIRVWKLAKIINSHPPLILINNLTYPIREDLINYNANCNLQALNLLKFETEFDEVNKVNLQKIVEVNNSDFWKIFDRHFDNSYLDKCKKLGIVYCLDELKNMINVFEIEQWSHQIFFN